MRIGIAIDDIGLHGGVDEAAAVLTQAGVVTALGCMTTAAGWSAAAALLRSLPGEQADWGLHLNFTEGVQGPHHDLLMPLPALIARSLFGALDRQRVADTVARQLDAFEDGLGRAPDFVDGHQHVHQLPVIRTVLLREWLRRYPDRRPWLRNTAPAVGARASRKHKAIASLGAQGLARQAGALGFPRNRAFWGVYGFDAEARAYRGLLDGWLRQAGDGDLLMCHPAAHTPEGDGIGAARRAEYAVWAHQGREALQAAGVLPVRLSRHPELLVV